MRVSRLTHRLAAQPPQGRRRLHTLRYAAETNVHPSTASDPPRRLFNRDVTLTSSLRVHCSSDFGVKSATQGQGGLSMALEPTRACADAWAPGLRTADARRSARDGTRRGAVGASSAAAAGRVRRARTAEVQCNRDARCALAVRHCGRRAGAHWQAGPSRAAAVLQVRAGARVCGLPTGGALHAAL